MADHGEDYRIIHTAATGRIVAVRLYDETWPHIIEQHPEFASRIPSLEHAIMDTIVNPTVICESTTQPETTIVFASSNNLKGNGGHMLQVPVRVIGDTQSGRVTTAMFAGHPKGKRIFPEGDENA